MKTPLSCSLDKYLEVVRLKIGAFFGVLFIDNALLTFFFVLFATLS